MHAYVTACVFAWGKQNGLLEKNPHVSLRTKVTMQDRKKKHTQRKVAAKPPDFGIATVLSARFHKR